MWCWIKIPISTQTDIYKQFLSYNGTILNTNIGYHCIPQQSCKVAPEILDYNLTLVEKVEGRATILQDLDKLEEWEDQNLIKFNKDKCQFLSREMEEPLQQHHLGTEQLGSSSAKKALEWWSAREPVGIPAAKAANSLLGCTKRGTGLRSREGIVPFYIALVRPCLDTTFSFGSSNTGKTWTNWRDLTEGPQGSGGWSICPLRRGWGRWDGSAWRRGSFRGTSSAPSTYKGWLRSWSCAPYGGVWQDSERKLAQVETREEKLFPQRQPGSRAGCPKRLCSFYAAHSWPCFEPKAGRDLQGPYEPAFFYDFSVILWLDTTSMSLPHTIKVMCMCLEDQCFLWSPTKHCIIVIAF